MDFFHDWIEISPVWTVVFIVCARIIDVSLGTIRTICVVRGHRFWAAILGFCEVMVWLLAVSGVLNEITWLKTLAYASGFALGNIVGVQLEDRLALGSQLIMAISSRESHAISDALRESNYTVTDVSATGGCGEVALSFTVVPRRHTRRVMHIAQSIDSDSFLIVQNVRHTPLSRYPTAVPATGWRAVPKKK